MHQAAHRALSPHRRCPGHDRVKLLSTSCTRFDGLPFFGDRVISINFGAVGACKPLARTAADAVRYPTLLSPTATESGRERLSNDTGPTDFFPGASGFVVIKITQGLASSLNHPSHPLVPRTSCSVQGAPLTHSEVAPKF